MRIIFGIFIILINGLIWTGTEAGQLSNTISTNKDIKIPIDHFHYTNNSNCNDNNGTIKNNVILNHESYQPPESKKSSNKGRRVKNRDKRQSSMVGAACQESIDCLTTGGGAYCDSNKRCDCLPSFVNINGYCWQKRNPDESCQYQEQCTSVSPNTFCDSSSTCRCINNQAATITADGPFCLLPGECPTNGHQSILRDYNSGSPVKCGGQANTQPGACYEQSVPLDEISGPFEVMYNCICKKNDPLFPEYPPCVSDEGAYCCPSRALSCMQPKDEGHFAGGPGQQRYWYNMASGNCEVFTYRGSNGNGNNFHSKTFCESYCKTTCPRGAPLRKPTGPNQSAQDVQCATGVGCGSATDTDYYCNTEGSAIYSLCCPSTTFICGSRGGIPPSINPIIPPMNPVMPEPGDRSYMVRTNITRFYYNSDRKVCLPFIYRGYAGTFNNFGSDSECRAFCSSTSCKAGEPLTDSSGQPVKCGLCPAKYECSAAGDVCCPSANFICSLPQAIGACSNFADRWWFNPMTRSCEKFYYSGCQGNYNNFLTYKACTDYCVASTAKPICPQGEAAKDGSTGNNYIACSGAGVSTTTNCPSDYYCHYDGTRYGCCPTRTKTCSVDSQDPGISCISPVSRWYYNSQTRLCDVFTYSGCDGNSNNFATKIDCQDYCGVGGCPEGGEPFRDTSTSQYRTCGTGDLECPAGHTCTVVTLGTSNRYNYCCPTRASVCAMNQDQGHLCGSTTLQRYFFNAGTKTCERFTYNGCGGNRNNFATSDQCLMYCNSAGCPPGQVALQDAGTKRVTTCDASLANGCPTNYRCSFSSLLQQGVCCGSNAAIGACPSGQIAYMDSFTNSPLQCTPNTDSSCPNGIFCSYSFALLNSFCCSTLAVTCPQGGDPYYDNIGSQPRQCTPGLPNVCPSGYTCQPTTVIVGSVTSSTGYCCGQANICGTGYTPYYVNNQPVPCITNQLPSNCPAPFACRQNVNSQSYCCAGSSQLAPVCAVGKEPLLNQGAPTLCAQISPNTQCPPGYTCDLYQQTGSYYCCRIGGILPPSTTGCPSPYTAYQPIRTCSPGVIGTCPGGYFCNYDSAGFRYICCGSPGGGGGGGGSYCPLNTQPYNNPSTGQPQPCMLGTSTTGCPLGYGCSYSNAYRNYYCCTRQGGGSNQCPIPLIAYIISSSGQPQTCNLNLNTCPFGYQCTSTSGGVGLCCGRGGSTGSDPYGCPSGTAYLYPGTRQPLSCTLTGARCPVGYSCVQSTRGALQCCSNIGRQASVAQPAVVRTIQTGNPTPSDGRRKCQSNLDCRDKNGNLKLCLQGYCLQ